MLAQPASLSPTGSYRLPSGIQTNKSIASDSKKVKDKKKRHLIPIQTVQREACTHSWTRGERTNSDLFLSLMTRTHRQLLILSPRCEQLHPGTVFLSTELHEKRAEGGVHQLNLDD